MKPKFLVALILAVTVCTLIPTAATAQMSDSMQRIRPETLAKVLNSKGPKPLVLQVGPQRLYRSAHIQGAEYAGPASDASGIAAIDKRVEKLKKTAAIVVYCGCCPWSHCPNVAPAYAELTKLGFKNVKVLYLPNNFKTDWHDKGYPTDTGE